MKFSDLYVNEAGRLSMAMIMLWVIFFAGVMIILGAVFGGFEVSATVAGLLMGLALIGMLNRHDSRSASLKGFGIEFSQERGIEVDNGDDHIVADE